MFQSRKLTIGQAMPAQMPTPSQDQINALINLYNSGQITMAEHVCRELLHIYPESLIVLNVLGAALKGQGKLQEAVQIFDKAIQLKPDHAETYNNHGVALQGLEQMEAAIVSYDKAIKLKPDYAEAYYNRSNVLSKLGRLQAAVKSYDKAIKLKPDYAGAYNDRGVALQGLKQLEAAVRNYNMAIQIKPDFAEAYYNRGVTLKELGQLDAAIKSYDKAIRLQPDNAKAYYNRGVTLKELGQLDAAIRCYDKAIQIKPDYAEACGNRGVALQELGQLDAAIKSYNKAIQLKPEFAQAHWNLSLALLLQGNFKDGWSEHEWRLKEKDYISQYNNYIQPQWDGSSLVGKAILLHAEQGAGDSIQFSRYIKKVAKYKGKIIVKCQESLVRLFSALPEIDFLVSKEETIPAFDVHAPFLSLPYILETDIDTIPADIPYLFDASNEHISLPQLSSSKLNVGVVWAGSPVHKNDKNRSASLSGFLPLASVPGIQLFSLQLGDRRKDLVKIASDPDIIDLADNIHDYADTAKVIAQLDLVISVDTSVVHLAGAMGKPTWVILPFASDFRWLLDRDDSPWYPTMRLFRQKVRGNWSDVFSKVKMELDKHSRAGSNRSSHRGNEVAEDSGLEGH